METPRVNSEGDAKEGLDLHVTASSTGSADAVWRMRERLQALKGLQIKTSDLEAQFFNELHALERRYSVDYSVLFDKRSELILGMREPTDAEISPEDDILKEVVQKIPANDKPGVPNFWLTVFKNSLTINNMLQLYDEPILNHLTDIKIAYIENPMGFRLDFHFSPNPYFSNTILTKEYRINAVPKHDMEIYKCIGCKIDWLPSKDVTIKIGKKRQRHRTSGNVRTVERVVKNESFFNFFDPPIVPDDPKIEIKDDVHVRIAMDYEVGQYFRTRIIPHAYLYFSGQVPDQDDNYQDLESETSEDSTSASDDE